MPIQIGQSGVARLLGTPGGVLASVSLGWAARDEVLRIDGGPAEVCRRDCCAVLRDQAFDSKRRIGCLL